MSYQPFNDLPATGRYVYVFRTSTGDAAYVGQTINVKQRATAHRSAHWFRLASSIELIPCADAAEAAWRERALIWELAPIGNVAGQNWDRYKERLVRLLRKGGLTEAQIKQQVEVYR